MSATSFRFSRRILAVTQSGIGRTIEHRGWMAVTLYPPDSFISALFRLNVELTVPPSE
jgi:hypothetical protein